jgi:hypothetical protein
MIEGEIEEFKLSESFQVKLVDRFQRRVDYLNFPDVRHELIDPHGHEMNNLRVDEDFGNRFIEVVIIVINRRDDLIS